MIKNNKSPKGERTAWGEGLLPFLVRNLSFSSPGSEVLNERKVLKIVSYGIERLDPIKRFF